MVASQISDNSYVKNKKISEFHQRKTKLDILVSRKSTEVETFAANQLKKYLIKITERPVTISAKTIRSAGITFVVGIPKTNTAISNVLPQLNVSRIDGDEDGFVVKSIGNQVYLIGNSPRAVLYAVYAFLERYMGVRWFYPDRSDEIIRKSRNLNLDGVDIAEKPTFKLRIYHILLTENEDSTKNLSDLVDWIAKLKMNYIFLNPSYDCSLWDRYAKRHISAIKAIKERGLKLIVGTHGWDNFLSGEYFSKYQQPCYHRKEVLELLAKRVIVFLKRHPEIDILNFMPTEGTLMCECNKCKKESHADLLMRGVNFVACRIKKVLPQVKVIHLAYNVEYDNKFLVVPKKVFPENNVMVAFCAWGRDYNESLSLPKYRDWQGPFMQWLKVCHSNSRNITFFMSEKYGRYGLGFGYHPLPLKVVPEDFARFAKARVDGIEMQAEISNWWSCGFGRYATARWMWDCHLSRSREIEDYCKSYYREAGRYMHKHFKSIEHATPGLVYAGTIHSQWFDAADHRRLAEINPCLKYLWKAEKILKVAANHLNMAKRSTKNRAVIARIRYAELAFEHVQRQITSSIIQHKAHEAILNCSAFNKRVASKHLQRVKKALEMEMENIKLYREGKDMYFWESRENYAPWRDPVPGNNLFLKAANAGVASCQSIIYRLEHLMGKGGKMVWVPRK